MRAFVALELPAALRHELGEAARRLGRSLPPARWVREENLHVTLVFLGEVSEDAARELDPGLREVFRGAGPLELELDGAGCFPPARPARVAWVGVRTSGDLGELVRRLEEAAADAAGVVAEGRPFHAHVTLARPRRPWPRGAVRAFVEGMRPEGAWRAEEGVLVRSLLTGAGARYEVEKRYPLSP